MDNKQKSIDTQKKLLEAAMSPSGLFVKRGDHMYTSADGVREIASLGSRREVFAYLYALYHLEDVYAPEINVFNPNPKEYDGIHVMARDMFLPEEQEKLQSFSLEEFISHCEHLVDTVKVPSLCVIVGADRKDIQRYNAMFIPAFFGDCDVIISVLGGTSGKNKITLDKIFERSEKRLNELKY